ncbi:chorismate mutase [bacterium]|nr:chorismate mutase [bacterium]
MTKGIRGAITVGENTQDGMRTATVELLQELVKKNGIKKDMISHVIFSVTKDLDKAFPAKFARIDLGWSETAMMCFNEADVENALKMCIRVLVVVNCENDFVPQFVYLRGAKDLRK